MKKKLVYLISSLFCFCILLTSCSDWLDVQPIDKSMENAQFSTETGVLSALEGLYKEMATTTLYGGNLSQTMIDAMANRYFYEGIANNATVSQQILMHNFSQYNYTVTSSETTIQKLWKSMYTLAFRTNNFINALEASSASITKNRKDLIMGEAYAVRAYIHFDLFRLFGPIYSEADLDEEYIPYNTLVPTNDHFEIDLIAYGNVTMRAFFDQLIKDIETAENLMKDNDPIVSDYATAVTQILSDGVNKNYENRNRRLNYYAVRALKARVLQYQGRIDEAAAIAQEILSNEDLPWAPVNAPTQEGGYDYTYFYEVLFGLDNRAQYVNGIDFFKRTRGNENYAETDKVHNIIYSLENDNRKEQWEKGVSVSGASGGLGEMETYRNRRYCNEYTTTAAKFPAGNYFQVLMRKSEMLYMVAESHIAKGNYSEAVDLLNDLLDKRNVSLSYRLGGDNNPTLVNDRESLIEFMQMEYYREFATEGQIFFFAKRHEITKVLNGRDAQYYILLNPGAAYTFPIPTAETNF